MQTLFYPRSLVDGKTHFLEDFLEHISPPARASGAAETRREQAATWKRRRTLPTRRSPELGQTTAPSHHHTTPDHVV